MIDFLRDNRTPDYRLSRAQDRLNNAKREVEAAEKAVLEAAQEVAQWMILKSYATGHGDTAADMLNELEVQATERANRAANL